MSIYTRMGDNGNTITKNGVFRKSDCLIRVNGKIDSLQAQVDRLVLIKPLPFYKNINNDLSSMAALIAGYKESATFSVVKLELNIDEMMKNVKLTGFIRFTHESSIEFNEARVRCRDLERELVEFIDDKNPDRDKYSEALIYINRLSDYFFAISVLIEKLVND